MPSDLEIVRALSEPFGGVNIAAIDWRSDEIRAAMANAYRDDFELRTLEGVGLGLKDLYTGLDEFAEYLSSWLEPFDEYYVEWLDPIDAGDFVLAPSKQWGTGSGSGVRTELEVTWLYELQGGKVARAFQYGTVEQAREAAARLA